MKSELNANLYETESFIESTGYLESFEFTLYLRTAFVLP